MSRTSWPTGLPHAPAGPLALVLAALLAGCGGVAEPHGAAPHADSDGAAGLVVLGREERAAGVADDGHGHAHGAPDPNERAYYHDFGAVPDGQVAKTVFRLRNTDPLPVTIQQVKPSCGCTVPALSTTDAAGERIVGDPSAEPEILVVLPGGVVDLEVSIDTARITQKNTVKLLQVRVVTDSEFDPFLTLECSILADQPFRVERSRADLGRMARSVGGRTQAVILPNGESGAVITGLGAVPDGIVASVERSPEGGARWTLSVEVLPPVAVGSYSRKVELLAATPTGEPLPPFEVEVRGLGLADVEVRPSRIVLRDFGDAASPPVTVEVLSNIPGRRLRIVRTSVTGSVADLVRVEAIPVDPDPEGRSERWEVSVSTLPGIAAERFSGGLRIEFEDPSLPPLDVTYAGM